MFMFKRQEYRARVTKTLNFENQIYEEFEEECHKQRQYPSHILQEFMVEFLEKKGVGDADPLRLKRSKRSRKQSPREIIDDIIGSQFTLDAWTQNLKEINDLERLENNLATGVIAIKNERYFRKTGRRIVVSGQTFSVPSMSK